MATNNNAGNTGAALKPSNLSDHYKPVGIQAVSAAAICRSPQQPTKTSKDR